MQQRLAAMGAQAAVAGVPKPQIITQCLAFPQETGLVR